MGKNVAVFVDVANIFYAAKAAGVDIDYVTLLKSASAGRDLVRAYAYTGLDPDNENQRNFHDFLRRHGYKVVSKDIRKYGDGKVKANLDIELVVDMMKTARNLDIAIVVSGDGDFAPAIRAVQEQGIRVEVISFRGNTSSDLIEVADLFTDITQLAKVDRDSTRSGRRVADDEHDLSMTEVPDKLTEGTGSPRGRGGRGRGRVRGEGTGRAEGTAIETLRETSREPGRRPSRSREPIAEPVVAAAPPTGGAPIVALPGEKLSRARTAPVSAPVQAAAPDEEDFDDEGALAAFGPARAPRTPRQARAPRVVAESVEAGEGEAGQGEAGEAGEAGEGDGGEAGRRRRRRGGRGRGRGRVDGAPEGLEVAAEEDDEARPTPLAPRPQASVFGSVWDSQLGTPSRQSSAPIGDDDDFDEPAIPEYLIAERRQRGAAGGARGGAAAGRGGARGGRAGGAYAAFVERERYGRGGGGGINRYPDVSGRAPVGRDANRDAGRDFARTDRPARPAGGEGGGEPWSEVPPELEALLRAQLAGGKPKAAQPARSVPQAEAQAPIEARTGRGRGRTRASAEVDAVADTAAAPIETTPDAVPAAAARRRSPRAAAPAEAPSAATPAAVTAPAAATPVRRTRATIKPAAEASAPAQVAPAGEVPTPRRTRAASPKAAAAPLAAEAPAPVEAAPAGEAPKPRRTRAAAKLAGEAAAAVTAETETPARRRAPRKAAGAPEA